jgi:pilus assembly protein TadC
MKAKPKESTALLRLGLMSVLLGIVAVAISPFSPSQLFAAFFGIGMFLLGLGFGFIIFSIRMSKLEKQNPPPPPPPP